MIPFQHLSGVLKRVSIMRFRLIAAVVILLAGFFAFGDFFQASVLSTPEAFVSEVGRRIGGAITGIATGVGSLFWG